MKQSARNHDLQSTAAANNTANAARVVNRSDFIDNRQEMITQRSIIQGMQPKFHSVIQRVIPYHITAEVIENSKQVTDYEKKYNKIKAKLRLEAMKEYTRIMAIAAGNDTFESIRKPLYDAIDEASASGDYSWEGGVEKVRQAMNILLRDAELKAKKEEATTVALPEVKIGNEFNFTNNDFAKVTSLASKKNWAEEKARSEYYEVYKTVLKAWDSAMKDFGISGESGKDEYDYPTKKYDFPHIDWSYEATFDDAVIEIITPPVPAGDIAQGEVAEAMDLYIFGVANQIGLRGGAEAGSGHINIDRVTGFESGGRDLARFMESFYKDSTYWHKEDPDKHNAPFPWEVSGGEKKKAVEILEKYSGKTGKKGSPDKFVQEMLEGVFDKANVKKKDMEPHFQALNVEHYSPPKDSSSKFGEKDEKRRRLEVRRVQAQKNRAHLIEQLNRLFKLMGGK